MKFRPKVEYFEFPNGNKAWFLGGERHREDGPAIEDPSGYKSWWINGECHREDGPAIETSNGSKAWYLNGEEITLETESKDPKVKKLQQLMKIQEILEG
jgi:hypothetical protein